MTEFQLSDQAVLGLMPEANISRILGETIIGRENSVKEPRAELYLIVDNLVESVRVALAAGAVEISPPTDRNWNHKVGYFLDPDGHVLALAEPIAS